MKDWEKKLLTKRQVKELQRFDNEVVNSNRRFYKNCNCCGVVIDTLACTCGKISFETQGGDTSCNGEPVSRDE